MILLGVYLFNSMKRYAINYTGGDTWFTMFAVIVVAVPIAELFCIWGQTLIAPILPVQSGSQPLCRNCDFARTTAATNNGKAPKEHVDELFLDHEKKGPVEYTTVPLQVDVRKKIAAMVGMTDAHIVALDREAARMIRCIIRVRISTTLT